MVMVMLWLSFFHFSYSDVPPLFASCVRVVTKRKVFDHYLSLYYLLVLAVRWRGHFLHVNTPHFFAWKWNQANDFGTWMKYFSPQIIACAQLIVRARRPQCGAREWINHSYLLLDLDYFLVFFCWNYIHWKSWYRAETSSQNWSMEIDICSITYIQQVEDVVLVYFMYSIVIFYYTVVSALYYVL